MSQIGNVLMALALASAIVSIASLVLGHLQKEGEGEGLTNIGYIATFGVFLFSSGAVLLLTYAFITENFNLEYVAFNHPNVTSSLRLLYQISGVWAGREGSLLFWQWCLAIFAAFVAYKRLSVTDRLSNMGLAVTNFVQVFFLVALFIATNNPFKASPPSVFDPATGQLLVAASMNPLLQTWAMIAHPPTLFIGYAGLTIPFAFAIAALIVGDGSKKWVELTDRITVFSWLFLGIGIGLGSIWAYIELAFGGFWAWDPVENASLLPWLTGVALIHSMTVYKRRGGFKSWTVFLSAVTFVVVLLGTFITRSGIVESVHAFQKDPLSLWLFLTMMVGSLAAAVVGLAMRKKEFASDSDFESLASKEASYYFNNVLMIVATALIAYWTMASSFPDWMPGGGMKFGAATYDAISRPVGILYVFIMGVCPILSWGLTDKATFWRRVKLPLVVAAAIFAGFMTLYFTMMWPNLAAKAAGQNPVLGLLQLEAIIGLAVAALAIGLPLFLFYDGARKRSQAKGESMLGSLGWIMTKARTQSGGYLTHIGIGIILFGLIGSTMFTREFKLEAQQGAGSTVKAGAYTLELQDSRGYVAANNDDVSEATFRVTKNGRDRGTITPRLVTPALTKAQGKPSVQAKVDIVNELFQDVFVTMESIDEESVALHVKLFPVISWVWAGFVLMIIGSGLAMWPKKARAA